MKFCKQHWIQLKEAIREKGMWNLICKNQEELHESMKNELEGKEFKFDPLMQATWAIYNRALEDGGLYLLSDIYCPLCEVNKCLENGDIDWIEGCCNEILLICLEQNLIKRN
jgi:hypothetical protein